MYVDSSWSQHVSGLGKENVMRAMVKIVMTTRYINIPGIYFYEN